MKWIVIIATCCYPSLIMTPAFSYTTNTTVDINSTSSTALQGSVLQNYLPSEPSGAMIVTKVNSKKEAEDFILTYVQFGPCSYESLIITPDNKIFTVSKVQKTKSVLREVQEPDGYKLVWSEKEK